MKPTFFLIAFVLYHLSSFGQVTLIPDPAFEQALIDLGIDSGPVDGSVPTSSMDTISHLDISNKGISDVTGIEACPLLQEFRGNMNNITSLDLSQNPLLIEVQFNNNNISFLDVTQCPDLEYLLLYWNELTAIDVTQNPALELFVCSNNPDLTAVDVTQNPALSAFNCQDCSITGLDLSQNPALFNFVCSWNNITQLDLSNNPILWRVWCYDNLLTELDLNHNNLLEEINCGNNNIQCLNINNGYSENITSFSALDNPGLTCIETNNPAWCTANLTDIDPGVSFSSDCDNGCSTAGVTDYDATFSVYPNPTYGDFTISLGNNFVNTSIVIYAADGKMVERKHANAPLMSFSLTGEKGIYFVNIISEDRTTVVKVVKN